ncbi:MAG: hypothetical protein JWO77_129 [Ilumatobacteraceae bacterium]|nr:hypothetical protein [Ilumatobacteraceae bacterium]
MTTAGRWSGRRAGRAVTVGLIVADALALAIIAWHASSSRWRLIGDPAVTTLRGRDVLSGDTPLLGMPSGFSGWSSAADPFHPGPVALWVLAPTKVFGAGEGVVLVISWLMLVASTLVIAAAARRVSGWWAAAGAVGTAVALQLTVVYSPIWSTIPPVLAIGPALALCFVAWAVTDGKTAWWPALVVIGAMVAGADLAYATVVVPLVVLAAARTIRDERSARSRSAPSTISRQTAILTVIAVVVTCALPVVEAVTNGGGNVSELLTAAGARVPAAGFDRAAKGLGEIAYPADLPFFYFLRFVLRSITDAPIVVPLLLALAAFAAYWRGLRGRRLAGLVIGCIVVGSLLSATVALALIGLVVVLGMIRVAVIGFRAPRPGTLPLLAVAGTAVLGALLGQWQTPAAAPDQPQYLFPVQVAGAITWFTMGWLLCRGAAALLARRAAPEPHRLAPLPRYVPVALVAISIVALAATGSATEDTYLQPTAQGLGSITEQLADGLEPGAYRWAHLGGPEAVATSHGVVLRMIPHGIVPHVVPADAKYYGSGRRLDGSELGTLYLTLTSGPPPVAGAQRVAWWEPDPDAADAVPDQAAAADLAERIRDRGLQVLPAVNSVQLGSLAAAYEGSAPAGQVLDDQYLYDEGERLRDDPDALAALPDDAVIELAGQGIVDATWLTDQDRDLIGALRDARPITVWLVPIAG